MCTTRVLQASSLRMCIIFQLILMLTYFRCKFVITMLNTLSNKVQFLCHSDDCTHKQLQHLKICVYLKIVFLSFYVSENKQCRFSEIEMNVWSL
jgi:hypothetical protein